MSPQSTSRSTITGPFSRLTPPGHRVARCGHRLLGDRGQTRRSGQVNDMGGALPSYVPLCVTEIRRWVVDEAAPHDDVGLLILDRFPCPQDTLAAETAALGDPLRALVVEMSDDLNPHDSMVSKGPLRDETERLHRNTTASDTTIKPVERLGSTRGEVELNANLTSAFV
jgi:hypothetical protein